MERKQLNSHEDAVYILNVMAGRIPGYWNVYFRSGVARIYLGYVQGSKTEAVNKARKEWPKFIAKGLFLTPNRSLETSHG